MIFWKKKNLQYKISIDSVKKEGEKKYDSDVKKIQDAIQYKKENGANEAEIEILVIKCKEWLAEETEKSIQNIKDAELIADALVKQAKVNANELEKTGISTYSGSYGINENDNLPAWWGWCLP